MAQASTGVATQCAAPVPELLPDVAETEPRIFETLHGEPLGEELMADLELLEREHAVLSSEMATQERSRSKRKRKRER